MPSSSYHSLVVSCSLHCYEATTVELMFYAPRCITPPRRPTTGFPARGSQASISLPGSRKAIGEQKICSSCSISSVSSATVLCCRSTLAVDMWALGCIMGELLTDAPLFGGYLTEKELLAELSDHLGDQITELFNLLPKLSPAGRELLTGLLAFDPEKRLTAAEALEHRWFSEEGKKIEFVGYVPLFG
ncbi:hypothetical protein GUJ93_ZPchr0010g7562 [Zizania palustris]|uniref:Protein kinase domain-containing protein n=1 Tax=Zizania palustris TaxID=103762 RepID=A0A8J5WG30_ZIZPA|nr:hypothetical protein GUJ93_ZPchr0010g7562 [Zizania palustris]